MPTPNTHNPPYLQAWLLFPQDASDLTAQLECSALPPPLSRKALTAPFQGVIWRGRRGPSAQVGRSVLWRSLVSSFSSTLPHCCSFVAACCVPACQPDSRFHQGGVGGRLVGLSPDCPECLLVPRKVLRRQAGAHGSMYVPSSLNPPNHLGISKTCWMRKKLLATPLLTRQSGGQALHQHLGIQNWTKPQGLLCPSRTSRSHSYVHTIPYLPYVYRRHNSSRHQSIHF